MSDSQEEFNMEKTKKTFDTRSLVTCAILTALVFVLQFMGSFIRVGVFSISLVLVPIVIGSALCGKWAGGWLGLVFGIAVLLTDSAAFMAVNPVGTVATVLVKGALAGFISGLVYDLIAQRNRTVAVACAALACPIVNTGIFLIGCKLFFMGLITGWAEQLGFANAASYMIYGLVGVNFLVEVLVNIVLCPIIVRLINIRKK